MSAKIPVAVTLAIACNLGSIPTVNAASTYQVFKPNKVIVQPNPQIRLAPLHVKCAAEGSPDFVHYGLLTNDGPRTIPAGTKLDWTLGSHSGKFTFPTDLARNKAVQFNLHFTTGAAIPCTAKFVQ